MDKSEGYEVTGHEAQNSYNRVSVDVIMDQARNSAWTYIAVGQADAPLPNEKYLKYLRDGAHHHNLPANYRQYLDERPHS